MLITYMQSHVNCHEYADEYGNAIQVHVGAAFKHSPITIYQKGEGFSLKEGSNDSRFVTTQQYIECIYYVHT